MSQLAHTIEAPYRRLHRPFTGARYRLEPVGAATLPRLAELRRACAPRRFFPTPIAPDAAAQRAWFRDVQAQGRAVYWLVYESNAAPCLGYVQLSAIAAALRRAELGVVLTESARAGGGHGQRLGALTCGLGFYVGGLRVIYACVHPDNTAAWRGLLRIGALPTEEHCTWRKPGQGLLRLTPLAWQRAARTRAANDPVWRDTLQALPQWARQ